MSIATEIQRLQTAHEELNQRANMITNSTGDTLINNYASSVDSYLEDMEELSNQVSGIWVFDFGSGFFFGGHDYYNSVKAHWSDGVTDSLRHFTNSNKIIIQGGKPYVLFTLDRDEYPQRSDSEFMDSIQFNSGENYGSGNFLNMYGLVSYEGLQQIIWCQEGAHWDSWDGLYLTHLCPFRYLLRLDGTVYCGCENNTYRTIPMDEQDDRGGWSDWDKFNFIFYGTDEAF